MMKIRVTVPRPIWLPKAPGSNMPAMMLRPGMNSLGKGHWEEVMKHGLVQRLVELGHLKVNPTMAEQRESTHVPDPVAGVLDMSIAKAKPWILANKNPDQLVAWRNSDSRSGIIDLIDRRLAQLEAEADDVEDELADEAFEA